MELLKWYSHYRLGDVLWHANFLRRLGGSHTFYCQETHHPALRDALEGCDVELRPIAEHPVEAIDAWIGSDQVNGRSFFSKGCPNDICGFLVDWFVGLCEQIGREPVITCRDDLLMDYPALHKEPEVMPEILVIDSEPQSSQCPDYRVEEMDRLVDRLAMRYQVVTVRHSKYTLSEIGRMARYSHLVIGVATGPLWPCLSVLSKDRPFMVLLDTIRLQYDSVKIDHYRNVEELTRGCEEKGLL